MEAEINSIRYFTEKIVKSRGQDIDEICFNMMLQSKCKQFYLNVIWELESKNQELALRFAKKVIDMNSMSDF